MLVSNGGMRACVLVGIPNTHRRRDMTGPTSSAEDRAIAPVVGGSATFRRFIKEELMPVVRGRYRTTGEAAIVGESLAGLFVVETLAREPEMFQTYIAIDPSLWWDNDGVLSAVESQTGPSSAAGAGRKRLFVASSGDSELSGRVTRLVDSLRSRYGRDGGVVVDYLPMPGERHATIYHPAALRAFRDVLAPAPAAAK